MDWQSGGNNNKPPESVGRIGKNKEDYSIIEKTGITNLSSEQLKALVEKYFQF